MDTSSVMNASDKESKSFRLLIPMNNLGAYFQMIVLKVPSKNRKTPIVGLQNCASENANSQGTNIFQD